MPFVFERIRHMTLAIALRRGSIQIQHLLDLDIGQSVCCVLDIGQCPTLSTLMSDVLGAKPRLLLLLGSASAVSID